MGGVATGGFVAGNWLAVGGAVPGLNQSGIDGRCPLPAPMPF